ncbi:MAG: F0F1 ATP synthase subunit B [Verrucomicrobiota bacterium]|nr:F0F1 ATP synthase subunit B [Verrucomicrobiota bacterium]
MLSFLAPILIATADATAAVEAAHGGDTGLIHTFGIDPKYVIMQVVSFLILTSLLYKFAFKPVLATMDERNKKIEDGLKYTEEVKAKLAETEKRQTEIIREAQVESQRILTEARTSAKNLYDKQVQEAAAKVEDMLNKGRQANELEHQKLLSEVRSEIARLVVLTSSRVLQKTLSAEEKSRLSDAAAREIASSN